MHLVLNVFVESNMNKESLKIYSFLEQKYIEYVE